MEYRPKYNVQFTPEAENDLWDIYRYIAQNDSIEAADQVLDNLQVTAVGLETSPSRGHYPLELERIGVREYKEILWKPYRIIYQILEHNVHVQCVFDGRRQVAYILQERLLRSD